MKKVKTFAGTDRLLRDIIMKKWIVYAITALVLVALGIGIGKFLPGRTEIKTSPVKTVAENQMWTCSMHPQVRQPKPGKCPICSMTLIPVKSNSTGDNGGRTAVLKLSPRAQKIAEVQTALVERKPVSKTIRMTGIVDYDESRIAHITARMPGRVDILYVNYTGIAVRKGDHMVGYYSPDLYVAQKELLQSAKALVQMRNNPEPEEESGYKSVIPRRNINERDILRSTIKRLKLWGLTDTNIRTIFKTGKVVDLVTLYTPISGIVIHKNAFVGKYFKTGDRLFTVADLSQVWIMLDAYESDLMWLRYGQLVEFTTIAYPGEVFKGRISFIDPVLDKETRTVKVRVDADNSSGKLKPEMFVNAIVKAKVAREGKVIDTFLAGKWICPMHPGVILKKPGTCPICGMKLVKAESLGYTSVKDTEKLLPLVIPASAPLITGKRAIVYIESRKNPGTFYGREIVLGPRAGDYYIVKSGLKAGELVVTNGNFKIDSSLQILARPSMMSAEEPATLPESKFNIDANFLKQLNMIYNSYFAIRKALADDDFKTAMAKTKYLGVMLGHVSSASLKGNSLSAWKKTAGEIREIVKQAVESKDINSLREDFSNLSSIIDELAGQFGASKKMTIIKFKCPMAFNNKGASWLQRTDKIANPYLGKTMLECGEKVEDLLK